MHFRSLLAIIKSEIVHDHARAKTGCMQVHDVRVGGEDAKRERRESIEQQIILSRRQSNALLVKDEINHKMCLHVIASFNLSPSP